jgi:hypothetical protein
MTTATAPDAITTAENPTATVVRLIISAKPASQFDVVPARVEILIVGNEGVRGFLASIVVAEIDDGPVLRVAYDVL